MWISILAPERDTCPPKPEIGCQKKNNALLLWCCYKRAKFKPGEEEEIIWDEIQTLSLHTRILAQQLTAF